MDYIDTSNLQGTENNVPIKYWIDFINLFLTEKVEKRISKKIFILEKILNENADKDMYRIIVDSIEELSNEDIYNIRKFINERLRFIYIYEDLENIEELLVKIQSNDIESLEEVANEYETVIKSHFSKIVKTKSNTLDIVNDLVLNAEGIRTLAEDQYNILNKKGYELSTGVKELDNFFNGGIRRGEYYLIGAKTGGFKSGTLLNLAYYLKLYNPKIETLDPTKKPLIIYFSMENTQRLTFRRTAKLLLNYSKNDLKTLDPETVTKQLEEKLNSIGDSNCHIKLYYQPSHTVTVTDLYGLIDELESEGYEIVSIIADYIKLFKPEHGSKLKELRHIMSDTSRALADLGTQKDIAIISAFQLNRDAIRSNSLSLAHVAEALSIIDHCDYAMLINRTYIPSVGHYAIQIFNGKQRSNDDENSTFIEDFDLMFLDKDNPMRLIPTKIEDHNIDVNQAKEFFKSRNSSGTTTTYTNTNSTGFNKKAPNKVTVIKPTAGVPDFLNDPNNNGLG
jgi:replicative DNA helicase